MNERERRKRQLEKARRLLAKVQRGRLGRAGDRADPKAAALLRRLAKEMALARAGGRLRGLPVDLDELAHRIRRNEPGWSLDTAALRVTRRLRHGGPRATGMGDPTTDYGDSTTDYEDSEPTTDYDFAPTTDYGSRLRSAGRMIRRSRSAKL